VKKINQGKGRPMWDEALLIKKRENQEYKKGQTCRKDGCLNQILIQQHVLTEEILSKSFKE
jgi:hypothetical protein